MDQQVWALENRRLKRKDLIKTGFAVLLVLSGFILDIFNIQDHDVWSAYYLFFVDCRFLGASLLFFFVCPYAYTRLKMFSALMAVWATSALIINLTPLGPEYHARFIHLLGAIFLIWLWRVWLSWKIPVSKASVIDGAYYYLIPVHSVRGLIGSLFFWWEPAYYETKLLIDTWTGAGWLAHNGKFKKVTDIEWLTDHVKGYKVPFGRNLDIEEVQGLNELEGKIAFPCFNRYGRMLM